MLGKKKVKKELVEEVIVSEESIEQENVVIDVKSDVKHVDNDSDAKTAFLKLIESYKEQNPVKYAQKEKAFLEKLETL